MATILLGSELGTGSAALAPLLVLARAFKTLGHRPVLALRDAASPNMFLARHGFGTLQAPIWGAEAAIPEAADYATVLRTIGFLDADRVAQVAARWRQLTDHYNPALVVAHWSPGLALAARERLPAVAVGDGFAVPPVDGGVFPPLGEAAAEPSQYDLLAATNAAQAMRGEPAIQSATEIVAGAEPFPCVLPDLDPYHETRGRPAVGPLDPLAEPAPDPVGTRVFVQLMAHFYDADAVLSAIGMAGMTASAWVRGVSQDFLKEFGWPGVELLTTPPDAPREIVNAAVVVHNGYLPLTTLCLSLGRPQVIIPDGAEAAINACRVQALGLARVVRGEATAENMAELINAAVQLLPKARDYAQALDRARIGNAREAILARCLELMAA